MTSVFAPEKTAEKKCTIWDVMGCGERGQCDDSISTKSPHIEMIKPVNPLDGRNVEYRNNWKITDVSGIDPIADVQLTTEPKNFGAGTRIKSSHTREKTISVTVRICPCEDCDIFEQRQELVDIMTCEFCPMPCKPCFRDGKFNFDDLAVRDQRYCIMRVRCCEITRDIQVEYNGQHVINYLGGCEYHTFTFTQPDPYLNYPQLQSVRFDLKDDDQAVRCPAVICGPVVNLSRINSFKKCIKLPYWGNVRSYPIITIVGSVNNLRIENTSTGAVIEKKSTLTQLEFPGCALTKLNFMRGQQSYTGAGENILSQLQTGCNNQFFIPKNCDKDIELCITGEQVDLENFKMIVSYWVLFNGFMRGPNDPEFIQPICQDCEAVNA